MAARLAFSLIICFSFLLPKSGISQWNPDAGLIQSLSAGATITTSSNTSTASKVIDGNEQSAWQSAGALPSLYIGRSDLNILLGSGISGICKMSGSGNCGPVTDGNLNTSSTFTVNGAHAWVELVLAQPSPLRNISMKSYGTDTVFLWIFLSNQDSIRIGFSKPATNYAVLRFPYVTTGVTKIKVISKQKFSLFEVAALAGYPTEYVTIDLGSIKSIGTIKTRHWSGTASYAFSTELFISSDNVNWQLVANLNPDALNSVTTDLNPPVNGRYVKIQHTIVEVDYAKVSIWEAEVFDEYGEYGPMPEPEQGNITLAEMLGVNGLWGWGYNMFSNSIPAGLGPTKFNKISSHARNYHNLYWDVSDPDSVPDYETMPYGLAIWWMDWDREYQAWKNAGLKVGATIQYNNNTVKQSSWDNPYSSAYNYAYAFARHFGPTYGNGLVDYFEAGNEPWDYPAPFYNEIQAGMIRGAKDGDSALFVLPCALQSDNPGKETATGGNYMGARLTEQDAPYIDGINVHHYSYTNNQDGVRIAVHPESKESELRGIMNDIRFRDANLPGKKIYVTEWGWDSDGAGESCTFGECVSENEQALYGVRGAMMFLRLGVDRANWYFYGNQPSGSLYSRCGLESSAHENKKSYYAFQALISKIGNRFFLGTIREDDKAWVYLFGDASGRATHIAAWRPVNGDDTSSVWISIPSYFPDSAWVITGETGTGEYVPANVTIGPASMNCLISSAPLVIEVGELTNTADCAGDINGSAFLDDCGVCSGGNTGHVPNSDKDCNGACFGSATLDSCGVCNGDNSTCKDCAGVVNGTAFIDDCGKCAGGTTRFVPNIDKDCNGVCFGTAIRDCNGDCNGSAFIDDCGICSGGNTGHVANSDKDCSGVCFGFAAIDFCGVCNGDNSSCKDCNGDLFGLAFLDDCGICSGGNTGHVANSDKDCSGACFGAATIDFCGVCNGNNSTCRDCNGDLFGSAFLDDCGICSGGNTGHVANSNKDCSGICFGNAIRDCNGDCNGTAFIDDCGICSNGNTGHVANSNQDCNGICFGTAIRDCNGVCNGAAFIDDCGICTGGNTGHVANSNKDCNGICFGTATRDCNGICNGSAFIDDCGICSGGNTGHVANSNKDCSGVCFGTAIRDCNGDCNGSAFIDACGICSGGNTGHVFQLLTFFRDSDNDGFGNPSVTTQACSAPAGYVVNNTDCNDNNANINPGKTEVCSNSVDENCDGIVAVTPAIPGNISGPSSVCKNSTGIVYSIAAVPGATQYLWTSNTSTAVIASGQGTTSITVNFSSNFSSTTLRVSARNACGTSSQRSLSVSSLSAPSMPGPISGPNAVCANQTNITYSVSSVSGITYNWTFPAGVTILSGQGTRIVVVKWGSSGGQISVVAINSNLCRSAARTKTINISTCKTDGLEAQNTEEANGDHADLDFKMNIPAQKFIISYPNPFNDILNIEFSLPEDSRTRLEIFDMTGRKIAGLFERDVEANELHRFEYMPDATVADGMIIYRLQTEQGTWYGKAVYVK